MVANSGPMVGRTRRKMMPRGPEGMFSELYLPDWAVTLVHDWCFVINVRGDNAEVKLGAKVKRESNTSTMLR